MGPDAVPTEVLVQAADAVRDLEQGKLVSIRRHDSRERNLPFLLLVYAVMALVMVGVRLGVMHAVFWLLLMFSLAAVGGALWASKQMIEVSADRNGIVLSRADQIVRLPWDDVKSVENNYRSECRVAFRRDTPFGRTIKFPLIVGKRMIGFDQPAALWMRQRIERSRDEMAGRRP